jgi:hypothetical protein
MSTETQPTPFLRYFHPKEFFIAHVIPSGFTKVLVGNDVVIVEEGAEVMDLVVNVGLFFGGETGGVGVDEMLEGGLSGEDVTIESNGTATQCNILRLADGWQNALSPSIHSSIDGIGQSKNCTALTVLL